MTMSYARKNKKTTLSRKASKTIKEAKTSEVKPEKSITKASSKKTIVPVPPENRKEPYWETLNQVIDPEIGLGIVELGLIYGVEIRGDAAIVTMTLTSPACPEGPEILEQVQEQMMTIEGINRTEINLVWEPVWGPENIDEDIRQMLFGL